MYQLLPDQSRADVIQNYDLFESFSFSVLQTLFTKKPIINSEFVWSSWAVENALISILQQWHLLLIMLSSENIIKLL